MGRKPKAKITTLAQPIPPQEAHGLREQTFALPRWGRILLCAAFAVATALLVTPIVDNVYVTNFFSQDTVMLPTVVSTLLGFVVYVVGYFLVIGQVGEVPPPRRAAVWYIALGLIALALVLILVMIGVYTNVLMRN
jgi:hypothetical protein